MKYACVAKTQGRARCRNFVDVPGDMCPFHQKEKDDGAEVETAPRPDTVLVKFNVNPSWNQKFQEAGVPRRIPSEWALEEKHIAQAKQVDREPYRFREIADSGVPIFGEGGVTDISILKLFNELQENGYLPQGVHIRVRKEKKFDVLVIPFVLGASENGTLPKKAAELLKEFLRLSCWGFVHVWANPPEAGKIVHTINLGHREPEGSPQYNLCFNHGLWAVELATSS